MTVRNSDLELIRSDAGDGGWSLHLRDAEDEDGIPLFIAASGPSGTGADGEWLRPNADDYAEARRVAEDYMDRLRDRIGEI